MLLPDDELIGVGGAIFDTFKRFENSDDNVVSAPCGVDKLLFVIRLNVGAPALDNVLPAVVLPFVGIRNLPVDGAGTIFEPCTRFTCRIMPSGAIM